MIANQAVFISHSTEDDDFVAQLRQALELRKISTWIDSRQMRGSDSLWNKVAEAISSAGSVIVVFSLSAINSGWVFRELDEALSVKKSLDIDEYRVIPLMLPGVKEELVKRFFGDGVLGVPVDATSPSGIQEAMPQLLAALGLAAPNDLDKPHIIDNTPIAELTLELSTPTEKVLNGISRISAKAKLVFEPDNNMRKMVSPSFEFESPIGLIEAEDIRWYLEQYLIWPSGQFMKRAKAIEAKLPQWGRAIYDALFANLERLSILLAWQQSGSNEVELRFSIHLAEVFGLQSDSEEARMAGHLLTIPWELLHDDKGFLFKGAVPVRVRRSLSNQESIPVRNPSSPLRILLVSPRPEGPNGENWLDPRASALPLVEAIEGLGTLAELNVLSSSNFPDFAEELQRAYRAGKPYDVVHFDGHGVYDPKIGLGALCFEAATDRDKHQHREMALIYADQLGAELQKHNIPLVFLEACQTSKTEANPNASVAARLLQVGVASVVSMSHSVYVVTASKFVKAFYEALADGRRIGAAMLAGQQALFHDKHRFVIPGIGKIDLQDWFVPVLFQDKQDPVLFRRVYSGKDEARIRQTQKLQLGDLPETPAHEFHGRDRELLYLERLLQKENYAVIQGIGGMGKTTLAVELARWLVRTKRFERAAFISVEHYSGIHAILHQLASQLTPGLSAKGLTDDAEALKEIARALEDFRTIIVFDNLESVLPAQGMPLDTQMQELLNLFQNLLKTAASTRLLFTSRETLPPPFADHGLSLGALGQSQAIALVRNVLQQQNIDLPDSHSDTHTAIQQLVDTVGGHPRALVLLAPFLRDGIAKTETEIAAIIKSLAKDYPNERERSLFASVELSLRRLTAEERAMIRPLAVFHGGFHAVILAMVSGIEGEDATQLAAALVNTGLATHLNHGHFRLDPALSAYLDLQLSEEERVAFRTAWLKGMDALMSFIHEQISQDANMAVELGLMELPNLMAALEELAKDGSLEQIIAYATYLELLIQNLGMLEIGNRVSKIREDASKRIQEWSHAAFDAERFAIERKLSQGKTKEAYQAAIALKDKAWEMGENVYSVALYDRAVACILLGRILRMIGQDEMALKEIEMARQGFEALVHEGDKAAEGMVAISWAEAGDSFCNLGRYEEAIQAHKKAISLAKQRGDARAIAVSEGQLGSIYLGQKKYEEALQSYQAAKATFERLKEPSSVATFLHQIGRVYQAIRNREQADQHYREALKIKSTLDNPSSEAATLNQLGNLYQDWNRYEEAVIFYQQAADTYVLGGDLRFEGFVRNNLGDLLIKMRRLEEARTQLHRAIECKQSFGLQAEPWTTYMVLCNLENAAGNPAAAAQARKESIKLFRQWRKSGAENHSRDANLCARALASIKAGEMGELQSYLEQEIKKDPEYVFDIHLLSIIKGSRDPHILEDKDLGYEQTVELELLLEALQAAGL